MKTQCAISVGVGQRFELGIERLRASLTANDFAGDVILDTEYRPGCPTHKEIPYGFKPWMFNMAREKGYKQVMWLDSACVVVKSLKGIFHLLKKQGNVFTYSTDRVWEWCSDACAKKMGVSRAKLSGYCPSLWACAMFLDFRHDKANEFLDKWLAYSRDGVTFHGAFTNENHQVSEDDYVRGHRHDQTVASILAFQLQLRFSWNICHYDANDIMPLENYESSLRLPHFAAPILANHNVKVGPHSE